MHGTGVVFAALMLDVRNTLPKLPFRAEFVQFMPEYGQPYGGSGIEECLSRCDGERFENGLVGFWFG